MKRIIIFAVLALVFTGCVKKDDLRFHEIRDVGVSLGTTTMINAVMAVENLSGSRIQISDAEFTVTDRHGRELGTLTLGGDGVLVIPRRSAVDLAVPLRFRLSDPFAGFAAIKNIRTEGPQMRVTGSAKIKAGVAKKKYKVEDMPLSKFISIFEDNVKTLPDLKIM